jgi:hypothetical protein
MYEHGGPPPILNQNLQLMGHHQILPNDEREQDRLDILHHVFRLTLGGGLCRTKLDSPQKILDVGTGTGIWAIES